MKHTCPPVSRRHMAALLDALNASDGLTRAALASCAGCGLMTVCRAEETLLPLGIIRAARERAGASGRPAAVLHPAFPVPVLLLHLSDSTASARLFFGTASVSDRSDTAVVSAGSPLPDANENLRLLMQTVKASSLPAQAAAQGCTCVFPVLLLPAPVPRDLTVILSRTVRQMLADCGLSPWSPPGVGPAADFTVTEPEQAVLYALQHHPCMQDVTVLARFSRAGSSQLLRRTTESPWFTPPGSQRLFRSLDEALYNPAGPDIPALRRLLSLFPPQAVLAESCPPFTDAAVRALRQALPDGTLLMPVDDLQAERGAVLYARRQVWDALALPHPPTTRQACRNMVQDKYDTE